MAGKYADLTNQIVVAIIGISSATIAIWKFMGLSKSFDDQQKKNDLFKLEVKTDLAKATDRLDEVEMNVTMIKGSVKDEFVSHKEYVNKTFMTGVNVKEELDRLDNNRADMFKQVLVKFDGLTTNMNKRIDKLEDFLTDQRNEELKEKTREIESLKKEIRDKS